MEQITAFLETIKFDEILTSITNFLGTIDLQKIVDDIINFVSGLIATK